MKKAILLGGTPLPPIMHTITQIVLSALFHFLVANNFLTASTTGGGSPGGGGGGGSISSVSVINATTGATIISSLTDGASIDLDTAPLTLTATPVSDVGSIKFELDGVEINRTNFEPYRALPDRIYKTPGTYAINVERRPLDFGVGIRTLTVTPYELPNAQGTPGDPFEITVKFIRTTAIGLTPSTTVVSNLTELQNAITAADDYDVIEFNSVINVSGYSPTIAKRIKLIGTGSTAELQNVTNWDIDSGITLRGFKVTSGTICFRIQDGAEGVFIGDLDVTNIQRLIRLANTDAADGVAINNIVAYDLSGNRPGVCDCFGQMNNVSIRNCDVQNLVDTDGAVQAFRIGSDTGTITNHDIIFEHNYVDGLKPDLADTGEVHGAHLFGNYQYIYNNTIKNVITDNSHSDHEGLDGKGDNIYCGYNWVHNGGAQGQEGHFNFKDEMDGGVFEHNLVTSNSSVDTGQGFTVHGDIIFRFNKAVLQHTFDSNGGFMLHPQYDGDVSFIHDNVAIINGGKFIRHSAPSGGNATVHVYNNDASLKNMEAEGVFFKNSHPANVTIQDDGGNSLCPPSGTDGSGCAPEFGSPDWTIGHLPEGNFLIHY